MLFTSTTTSTTTITTITTTTTSYPTSIFTPLQNLPYFNYYRTSSLTAIEFLHHFNIYSTSNLIALQMLHLLQILHHFISYPTSTVTSTLTSLKIFYHSTSTIILRQILSQFKSSHISNLARLQILLFLNSYITSTLTLFQL